MFATHGLVCFIACHMSSRSRTLMLGRMLRSILAQTGGLPVCAMSWSADPPFSELMRKQIGVAVAGGLPLRDYETEHRLSQFEHYRHLTELHCGLAPSWVFFSDDDDIWSPTRYGIYQQQCSSAPPTARAVLCRRKAMHRHSASSVAEPEDAAGVCALIASGAARLTDADLRDGLDEDEHNLAEYFE